MTSRAKQELLKECDEQIKMCNTMSFIGGCDTIAQYKIKKWVMKILFLEVCLLNLRTAIKQR